MLFGNGDDINVFNVNTSFTSAHHLLLEWTSNEMAKLLQEDINRPTSSRQILTIAIEEDDSLIRAQLADWRMRLHSIPTDEDDPIIDTLTDSWYQIRNQEDSVVAWGTVLAMLIRHPTAVLR